MKKSKFKENFKIVSTLGKGSFSIVYKVLRQKNNKFYAMKKVRLKNLKEKEIQNALNEIRILASIKHPHIIGYREAFIDHSTKDLCIIMDYCGGGDLSSKIKQCRALKIRIPEKTILRFFY